MSEGLLASGRARFRVRLASVISDVEARRDSMTTPSQAMSQILTQVKAELSTLRVKVERLSSDTDAR